MLEGAVVEDGISEGVRGVNEDASSRKGLKEDQRDGSLTRSCEFVDCGVGGGVGFQGDALLGFVAFENGSVDAGGEGRREIDFLCSDDGAVLVCECGEREKSYGRAGDLGLH